jgi:anti-anti-sigma factor
VKRVGRGYAPSVVSSAGRIGLVRTDPRVVVVEVEGEHDLNTAPLLRREAKALQEEDVGIVLDLESATFLDSSILALVLELDTNLKAKGRGFAVALPEGSADAVRRLIEVTGLDGPLAIAPSREEAVAAAGGGTGSP